MPNPIRLRLYLLPFASTRVQLRKSLSAAAGAQRRGLAYSTFHLAGEECLSDAGHVSECTQAGGHPHALPNSYIGNRAPLTSLCLLNGIIFAGWISDGAHVSVFLINVLAPRFRRIHAHQDVRVALLGRKNSSPELYFFLQRAPRDTAVEKISTRGTFPLITRSNWGHLGDQI